MLVTYTSYHLCGSPLSECVALRLDSRQERERERGRERERNEREREREIAEALNRWMATLVPKGRASKRLIPSVERGGRGGL